MPHGADLLVLPGQVAVVRELRVELLFEQLVFHLELHALLRMHHGTVEQNVRDQKQRHHNQQRRRIFIPRRIDDQRLKRGGTDDLRDRKRRKDQQLLAGEVIFRARQRQTEHQQHQCQKQHIDCAVNDRARVGPDGVLRIDLQIQHVNRHGRKQHLQQDRAEQIHGDREQLAQRLAVKQHKRQRERPGREQQQTLHAAGRCQREDRDQVSRGDPQREQRRDPPRKTRPVEHAPQKHAPDRHHARVENKVRKKTVIHHAVRPPRQDLRRPAHRSARPGRPAAGKTPPWPRPGASG